MKHKILVTLFLGSVVAPSSAAAPKEYREALKANGLSRPTTLEQLLREISYSLRQRNCCDAGTQTENVQLPNEMATQTPRELTKEEYAANIERIRTSLHAIPQKHKFPANQPILITNEKLRLIMNLTVMEISLCTAKSECIDGLEMFRHVEQKQSSYNDIFQLWEDSSDEEKKAWKVVDSYDEGIPFLFTTEKTQ